MGFDIRQSLTLNQRQEQRLVMTQQMQQAITMLQLSQQELIEQVTTEMVENPMLEGEESSDSRDGSDSRDSSDSRDQEGQRSSDSVAEVPSVEDMSPQQEQAMREEVEWGAYVSDTLNYGNRTSGPVGGYTVNEDYTPIENRLTRTESLLEHLEWQVGVSGLQDTERQIAEFIVGNLDSDGYLRGITMEEVGETMGCSPAMAERVLKRIQRFDPVGVGARSLAECLLIQANHFGFSDPLMERILSHHIRELERKDYVKIARACKVPQEQVHETVRRILTLDPKPGRAFSSEEVTYIKPDVFIYKQGDSYVVQLNDDGLPKLRLASYYQKALRGSDSSKEYVEQKLRKAKWLIQAIQMRQKTITDVANSIVKFQYDFFENGPAHLVPLTLRDVAEDVGRHESTVSRVTSNKYAHTPQGLFELKFFFSSAVHRVDGEDIASQSVKTKIKELIAQENPKKPLSDQKLADQLREQGIDIARRTVAKYREQLHILSSSRRRTLL